jgi:ribosomal protein L11 methylase PrmA
MREPASFRDPSGFLFHEGSKLLRQVNLSYKKPYDLLMSSGLYEKLTKGGILISHQEIKHKGAEPQLAYKVIQPEKVDFISYPYEWSFHELKDAALVTLRLQQRALEFGMVLKDASAYNIQLHNGRMRLIDTLSFDIYEEGKPWDAYRQFCQHFLAPFALMAYTDIRLSQLMRVYIDGIPLDLAVKLLPFKARLNAGLLSHVYLHAAAQNWTSDQKSDKPSPANKMTRNALLGLVSSLESTVRKLDWKPAGTEWADYYDITNYSNNAFDEKKKIVSGFIQTCKPKQVWDLGGNTGVFSRLASEKGILTVSSDIDPSAVDRNYLEMKEKKETSIIPLVLDLTNPSAGMGWANRERESFTQRGPVDLVMALALIHHLAISNNVPLSQVAEYFAELGKWLVIEFIPKEDSQVQILLKNRKDIFDHYNQKDFESEFGKYFKLNLKKLVKGSKRTLYLFEKRR